MRTTKENVFLSVASICETLFLPSFNNIDAHNVLGMGLEPRQHTVTQARSLSSGKLLPQVILVLGRIRQLFTAWLQLSVMWLMAADTATWRSSELRST
jgi:hypothetical protein